MTLCSVARHGGPRPQATSRTAPRTSPNASEAAEFSRLLGVSHCAEPVGVADSSEQGLAEAHGAVDAVPAPLRRGGQGAVEERFERRPRLLAVSCHQVSQTLEPGSWF